MSYLLMALFWSSSKADRPSVDPLPWEVLGGGELVSAGALASEEDLSTDEVVVEALDEVEL